jgi:hypothetical protein
MGERWDGYDEDSARFKSLMPTTRDLIDDDIAYQNKLDKDECEALYRLSEAKLAGVK